MQSKQGEKNHAIGWGLPLMLSRRQFKRTTATKEETQDKMAIEIFFYMSFAFGAITGSNHPPFLEYNKHFLEVLKTYAMIGGLGLIFFFGAGLFCKMGNCNSHPALVGFYLVSGFLMGLGGTGLITNISQMKAGANPSGNNDIAFQEVSIQEPMV